MFDIEGNPIQTTDALSHTTNGTVDSYGNVPQNIEHEWNHGFDHVRRLWEAADQHLYGRCNNSLLLLP